MTAASTSVTRRFVVIGGVVPVVIALASAILMISWIPDLPDPIAIHWSGSTPDGFGSPWALAFVPLGITLLFCAISLVALVGAGAGSMPKSNEKFLVVTGVWVTILMSIGIAGSVGMQRGMTDAADAGDPLLWILIGAGVGLAGGGIAWLILPAAVETAPDGEEPTAIRLGPGERVAWSRSASIAPGVLVLISAVVLLSAVALVDSLVRSNASNIMSVGGLLLILVLLATSTVWRVSADHRGLVVRSVLGWPRVRIPVADIHDVQVLDVSPVADFGGWGYRFGSQRRRGIILRAGDAIEVTRSNGTRFVITVADARTGAGVLAALVGQASRPGDPS